MTDAATSGSPHGPPIPQEVLVEYDGWERRMVSHFEDRTATYRLESAGGAVRFVKIADADWFPTLESEAVRTTWAGKHLPVPTVLAQGSTDRLSWLVTHGLPGRDATDRAWRSNPAELARVLARGLRTFHRASVEECPFDFRLEAALDLARRRLAAGRVVPERDFHPEFAHLTADEAVERLEQTRPAYESLVVCHGDYCLPNVLIEDGEVTGFVDLGELGVADRWWDLAVATWSLTWNLGRGQEERFLAEYGAELVPDRVAFYRLLYDVVS